jgi:hypothetical protein
MLGQPFLQEAGDEFAAVIAADVGGCAPLGDEPFHDFDEVTRGEFAGHMQCQAFPAVFVDNSQDAQPAPVVGPVEM